MAEPFFSISTQGNLDITADSIMEIVHNESRKALLDSMKDGKKVMKQAIEDANAVASKETLKSVSSKIDSLAMGNWVYQGEIYFKGLSAERVKGADTGRGPNKGTGSGTGFYQAILAWTAVKGIDSKYAYPIMRQLIKTGTNVGAWKRFGRTPFLADGTLGIQNVTSVNFDKAAERMARRIENAHNSSSTTKS